ncbi:MAG: sialidase family protein [Lentisphaeria bacterium]|nr:sialidase family protein [Lentisphaeria bacterium]
MNDPENTRHIVKPLHGCLSEILGIGAHGGVVALADGSIMLAQESASRISTDGGRTWSDPYPLSCPIPVGGVVRLQSGGLAVYGSRDDRTFFSASDDDGKSWSEPKLIGDFPFFRPLHHSMIQLQTGRLLLAGYIAGPYSWEQRDGTMVSVHPDLQYDDVMAYGTWRGRELGIEGHGHAPEMGATVVCRSDDEGRSWTRHPGAIMGWFDFDGIPNGHCGQTSCFEPTFAETPDGNVLLLMRSTVGRLVQSDSTDGGEHWSAVVPSDLPSSESPGVMVRLPATGDLLLVWNQVSRDEIRRGYRRGRLSSAISRDGGHRWSFFKTLELSEGLEDLEQVPPEYPIQMVRARDRVGPLPDGWAYFHYANLDVIGDTVILRYPRGGPLLGIAEQNLHKQESVMRVCPLQWFYE